MCHNLHAIRDQVLDQPSEQNWEALGWRMHQVADDLRNIDSSVSDQVSFLSSVFLMELVPSNTCQPYVPLMVMKGRRTPLPEDFEANQLALLDDLLEDSASPVWNSRIADVLWIRRFRQDQKREVDYAQQAITQYLDIARDRENFEEWLICGQCLERALGLAREIRQSKALDTVIAYMEEILHRGREQDPLFLSSHLMNLLLDCDVEEPEKYLKLSREHAELAEEQGNYHKAETYWTVHRRWAIRLKDAESRQRSMIRIAEGYVAQAQANSPENGGSSMAAAHWLEQATKAYRNIPQHKERRVELYSMLRKVQQQALLEFKKVEIPVRIPVDIADSHRRFLAQMQAEVKDKDLQHCLYFLAFRGVNYPNYSHLHVQAQELIKDSMSSMFSKTWIDAQGKIVVRNPGTSDAKGKEQEEAEWQMVLELARIDHVVSVHGFIEPIRQYI